MNKRGLLLILLVVCVGVSRQAMAWGAVGHKVVATIAERRLAQTSPEAAKRAADLLRSNNESRDCQPCNDARTFAAVSSDPDGYRQIELALVTGDWHFVNIDIEHPAYDPERDCANGDCVIRRIDRMVEILGSRTRSNCEREAALIYLIHFMGDMHQPFHTGFGRLNDGRPDLGGNLVKLNFEGQDTNLHSLWDSRIIEKQGRTDGQWVNRLLTTTLNGRDPETLARGTTTDWLNESHVLAQKFHTTNKPFNADYVKEALPVIEERMLLGGLRLARLIEDALK